MCIALPGQPIKSVLESSYFKPLTRKSSNILIKGMIEIADEVSIVTPAIAANFIQLFLVFSLGTDKVFLVPDTLNKLRLVIDKSDN